MEKNNLKDLAYKRATDDTEWQLKLWWSTTFNRPLFHESMDDYIDEELILEFYMNKFFTDDEFRKKYEKEVGAISADEKEDEEWFKKMMADEYVDPTKEDDDVHERF